MKKILLITALLMSTQVFAQGKASWQLKKTYNCLRKLTTRTFTGKAGIDKSFEIFKQLDGNFNKPMKVRRLKKQCRQYLRSLPLSPATRTEKSNYFVKKYRGKNYYAERAISTLLNPIYSCTGVYHGVSISGFFGPNANVGVTFCRGNNGRNLITPSALVGLGIGLGAFTYVSVEQFETRRFDFFVAENAAASNTGLGLSFRRNDSGYFNGVGFGIGQNWEFEFKPHLGIPLAYLPGNWNRFHYEITRRY